MVWRRSAWLILAIMMIAGAVAWAAGRERMVRRWAQYEPEMQDPVADPPDAWQEAEFAVGRLRFRSPGDSFHFSSFHGFQAGRRRWGTDANKADRAFSQALRRLTRIDVRSVEQIVDINSDEMYDWPWMLALSIGDWQLNDSEVEHLRNYLERGGFLMVDDFHGAREWQTFAQGMARIVPNSRIIELKTGDPIFHTVYDLDELAPVSRRDREWKGSDENGENIPRWRGVVDEKGRIQVAICFNQEVGDSWERADDPKYPEELSSLGLRMGVNYALYAMTH